MTIVAVLHSHIMRQKSATVCSRGPWVAMYSRVLLNPYKRQQRGVGSGHLMGDETHRDVVGIDIVRSFDAFQRAQDYPRVVNCHEGKRGCQ